MSISPIAGQAAGLRASFATLLWHRYDRIPVTAGSDTGYGPTPTEGTTVTGLACRYEAQERVRLRDGDSVRVTVSTLQIAYDSPLVAGDLVANVRESASGPVLIAGPIEVEEIEAEASLGPTLFKTAVLRGGDVT